MHALRLASGTPSALLDWNNNYGDDPNKAVCFHCSNLPKHFFADVKMDFQEIIAGTVGKVNTFGTCVGRVKASPMSYARFSTNDRAGKIRGYVGDGEFTDDPLKTFGGAGVVEIPRMQDLLRYICDERLRASRCRQSFARQLRIVYEAATRYLGWEMYWHNRTQEQHENDRCWSRFRHSERSRFDLRQRKRAARLRNGRISAAPQEERSRPYATQSHADHMAALALATQTRRLQQRRWTARR